MYNFHFFFSGYMLNSQARVQFGYIHTKPKFYKTKNPTLKSVPMSETRIRVRVTWVLIVGVENG